MYSAAVFAVTFSSKSPIFARMASRGIASESLNIIPPHSLCEMRCTGAIAAAIIFRRARHKTIQRSEEHTSELQSLMRISYAVFGLKKKIIQHTKRPYNTEHINTNNTNKYTYQ